jgi:hypothetical protein
MNQVHIKGFLDDTHISVNGYQLQVFYYMGVFYLPGKFEVFLIGGFDVLEEFLGLFIPKLATVIWEGDDLATK